MEEILVLQAQLEQVQEKSAINQLSDRNVVEILSLLMKKHNLDLIYTIDGQEYLTPDYLQQQIEKVVKQKGRINIIELPKILNISIEKIEAQIP